MMRDSFVVFISILLNKYFYFYNYLLKGRKKLANCKVYFNIVRQITFVKLFFKTANPFV
jgi:hypothetical protein